MRTSLAVTFAIAAGCGGTSKQSATPAAAPKPISNVAVEPPPPPVAEPEPDAAGAVEEPPPADDSGVVGNAGVLGETTLDQGGAFASLTGTGDISSGFDDTNIYGGLLGSEIAMVDVKPGKPVTKGKLSRSLITRHVKDNLDKIIHCYEQQAVNDSTIAGTLETAFTIEADGTVSDATATGVQAEVATCVAEVIKAIRFPRPKRGTVQVTYPFELSSNAMNGGFGFGRSGYGPGGGGTGWGTIGTGHYGTIGHGSGTGSGYGVGGGGGGMRGRTTAVPNVRIGQPIVTGDLDKAIIRRYVKRNIQKISYCYEKQLLASPELAGKVTAKFTIEADGTVTGATADGVDATVASCVAGVLGGIEYPKPKGGGTVQVEYPMTFAPTGG